jgi:quinol-cytochrome oxidoreductase complex cytochrome b subunit
MADFPYGRKKMMEKSKIESGFASDAKKEPRRIVFITRNTSAKVVDERGPKLMTYPNLLVREAIVFEVLIVAMVLVALFWDAPLEQLANPLLTPNPAKAPWYFLGLQELLHFFPPFVAGILIPTLVLLALVVIPYFNMNVEGKPLWEKDPAKRLGIVMGVVIALLVLLAVVDAWTIIVPTVIVTALLLASYQSKSSSGWLAGLRTKPLSCWVMTWFIATAVCLTVVGTFFRGPGWSWVWPWGTHAG